MELQAEHAVSHIHQRRAGVLLDHAAGALQIRQHDDPGPLLERLIAMGAEVEVFRSGAAAGVGGAIERGGSAGQHLLHTRRQRAALAYDALRGGRKIERIPQLERPQLVGIAPAHGAIDLDDAVRNFGDHSGGVHHVIAEQLPEQRSSAVRRRDLRCTDQGAQPLAQVFDIPGRFDRRKFGLLRRMVFQRLPVDGVNFFGRADPLVEALAGLIAEPAALDHAAHELGQHEALAPRIAGNRFVEIASHMGPYVQADDVHQAEAGAVGKPDQRAGERVHFFDRVIVLHGYFLDRAAEEASNAVGDEVRRILTADYALAQVNVAETGNGFQQRGIGGRAGNHFDQMQIARWIEEVRAQEMAPQLFPESFGDACQRNAAGVAGEDRARRAHRFDFLQHVALDVEVLGDGLEDPVAVANGAEVILEVTGLNEGCRGRSEERGGFLLHGGVEALQRRRIAVGLTRHDDIEKKSGHAGVGEVRRNPRSHGSCAQDGYTSKWFHVLRRV